MMKENALVLCFGSQDFTPLILDPSQQHVDPLPLTIHAIIPAARGLFIAYVSWTAGCVPLPQQGSMLRLLYHCHLSTGYCTEYIIALLALIFCNRNCRFRMYNYLAYS
ncbi:hypothetical protein RchiOBHm_Chr1g0336021 [Rosa chinensis]|uniref:Uncharacterized protein n=1 Tax=Rosa chinensis TaxID=74649 RepID=A0A2P6SCJ8_ROSCH|nr:hypothetical protein RchiOBHm_Chr1g0336021 [Rosa chinensis]